MKIGNGWNIWFAGICLCGSLITPQVHAETGRVIVKYRSTSTMLSQPSELSRRNIMTAQIGLDVTASRIIGSSGRMQTVRANGISTDDLVKKLATRSDVEFVVPDVLRHPYSVSPSDAYFSNQWYLQSTQTAAIKADQAWSTTTGSSSIVVAVVDTGILSAHPDLTSNVLFNSDGSVYGYDFVSDTTMSNDNDGWDTDPSDPGDWVTQAESSGTSILKGCDVSDSSWHGTVVSGVIGAVGNNNVGVAGVNWAVKILPVRVMGKCGGYDSDIIAGMEWAAGLTVSGTSYTNTSYPAKVINLSLGGSGTCTAAYTAAVSEVTAAGALVVVSAGNSDAAPGVPANCSGVLTVGALSNTGAKTYYSSYGSAVGISAPGGNPNQVKSTCTYPIYSTSNSSTTSPDTDGYTYTTTSDCEMGTSFSAPLVSGVAGLMLAVNSSLTPTQLISLLKSSVTTFPTTISGVTTSCASKQTGTDTECLCTTATCGAGMLNATAAVSAAQSYSSASSSAAGAASSATSSVASSATSSVTSSTASSRSSTSTASSSRASSSSASSRLSSSSSSVATSTGGGGGSSDSGSSGGGGGGAAGLVDLLITLALAGLVHAAGRGRPQP